MCAQCMMTATAACAGASGLRAWLAARNPSWLNLGLLRAVTIVLVAIALVGAGAVIG